VYVLCRQYISGCVLHGDQMLTDDEKKQAQLVQKANPDMMYLNDINVLVSRVVVSILRMCRSSAS